MLSASLGKKQNKMNVRFLFLSYVNCPPPHMVNEFKSNRAQCTHSSKLGYFRHDRTIERFNHFFKNPFFGFILNYMRVSV